MHLINQHTRMLDTRLSYVVRNGLPLERKITRQRFMVLFNEWQIGNDRISINVPDSMFVQLEQGCYDKCVNECIRDSVRVTFCNTQFVGRYSTITSRVGAHLMRHGSVHGHEFVRRLIYGLILPVDVAMMTSEQLCPDVGVTERAIIKSRLIQKLEKKISRIRTCPRCHENKTISREYRGRCGDEALNTSIKCVKCGHTWRSDK